MAARTPGDDVALYDTVAPQKRPVSLGITIGTLVASLLASLIITVCGAALVYRGVDALSVVVALIGVALLGWHVRCLLVGVGRTRVTTHPRPYIGLICLAGFGVITGYGLFELLIGQPAATRVAMLVAGLVGMATAIVVYIRDSDEAHPPAGAAEATPADQTPAHNAIDPTLWSDDPPQRARRAL